MDELIKFQKQRIEALEEENKLLKQAVIRKESSVRDFLNRLTNIINDPNFQKPIHNQNFV